MLLTIALILLVLAVLGGLLVHPLIFLLALVAVVVLVSNRRGLGTGQPARRDSLTRGGSRTPGRLPGRATLAGSGHRGREAVMAQRVGRSAVQDPAAAPRPGSASRCGRAHRSRS